MNPIDNSNLTGMCRQCNIAGFVPVVTYVYDSTAKTVAFKDGSTFPAGDGLKKVHVRVHDAFGGEIRGTVTLTGNHPVTLDVSTLNASKGLNATATIITNNAITADGDAVNIVPAGALSNWDAKQNAQ